MTLVVAAMVVVVVASTGVTSITVFSHPTCSHGIFQSLVWRFTFRFIVPQRVKSVSFNKNLETRTSCSTC